MKWVQMSWRNIWRHTRRSFLSASILAFGTIALLTAIGFMLASFNGLREATIRGGLGHIQVSAPDKVLQPNDLREISEKLKRENRVRFTMQRVVFEGLISNGPNTVAVIGSGIEPEQETRLSGGFAPIVAGSGLPADGKNASPSALLGIGLAAKLGAKPGDSLTLLATTVQGVLNAIDVEIVGTFTTGVPELDARQVLLPFGTGQSLLNTQGASRLIVVLKDTENTPVMAAWLRGVFPNFKVATWHELAPYYEQVVTLYKNIFTVLGIILLLVVSMSVTNTMLMAISERLREMGTMLALGISRWRIRVNFAIEGAIMGGLGGATGLIAAAAIATLMNFAGIQMPPPPGRSSPYPLVIFVDPYTYAIMFAIIIVAAALAAWLPTRRLARLEIVEALRQN